MILSPKSLEAVEDTTIISFVVGEGVEVPMLKLFDASTPMAPEPKPAPVDGPVKAFVLLSDAAKRKPPANIAPRKMYTLYFFILISISFAPVVQSFLILRPELITVPVGPVAVGATGSQTPSLPDYHSLKRSRKESGRNSDKSHQRDPKTRPEI